MPALRHPAGHPRRAPAGRKLSRWISWMRGQVSWTGRRICTRDDRRLLDRRRLELAAIAAAGERRDRSVTWLLGEAGGAGGGGAGEARRLGRRPDLEPVAGRCARSRSAARSARRARGRPRSAPRSGSRRESRRPTSPASNTPVVVAGVERGGERGADARGCRPSGRRRWKRGLHRVERACRPPTNWSPTDRHPVGILDDPERARHARRRRPRRPRRAGCPAGRCAPRHRPCRASRTSPANRARAVDLGGHVEPRQRLAGQPVLDAAAHRQVRRAGRWPPRPRRARRRRARSAPRQTKPSRRVELLPIRRPSASAAAMQSSARAAAPASRSGASKARTEVEPPVSISALRVAKSRAAQRPTPRSASGQPLSSAASSASRMLA